MNGNTATYCPEDNKLRLYVGRVPRDEYERLRREGWVSTPKQSCDFVATWTPQRRNTALEYAKIIEDEDMSPEERAADRAERFSGYREKRTGEAVERADNYDAAPQAHGFQSAAKAERAAAKHDRIGDRACDAWSKAEYWQRRTAGVISHALYKSTPGVRMGRIKELEADLRKHQASHEEWHKCWTTWKKIADMTDPEKQTKAALAFSGYSSLGGGYHYRHPRPETCREYYRTNDTSLYSLLTDEKDPITGAEACNLFFAKYPNEPQAENDWSRHYQLRLAYENQMLEAQGGRAAFVEMEVGGWIGEYQIHRVNKSNATGRVVSVHVRVPKVSGYHYRVRNVVGAEYALQQIDTERLPTDAYRQPTEADKAALAALLKKAKEAAPKKDPCPLVNPTDADAERLQAIWNERGKAQFDARSDSKYCKPFEPSTVCRVTQAVYSANSKGTYAKAEARGLCRNAELSNAASNLWSSERAAREKRIGAPVCKVRRTSSDSGSWPYVDRVIVITDKPQKALPAEVWPNGNVETAEESAPARKFWNCDCGHQEETSAVYDLKLCPKCGLKMHDDTTELVPA